MAKAVNKKIVKAIANAQTLGELKNAYLQAMLKYVTPALLDTVDAMYVARFDEVKNLERNKDGEIYEWETSEEVSVFLNAVHHVKEIEGVVAEMRGSWFFVKDADGCEGTCKENHEKLNHGAGLSYAAQKKEWFLKPARVFNKRG